MGFTDLIIFFFYVIIFSLIFKIIRNQYDDPILKKYHRQSFWLKVFACIVFSIYSVYLSPGDSINLYQTEGNNLYHLILQDHRRLQWVFQKGDLFNEAFLKNLYNQGYFRSESNFMIIRFVTLLSFITSGSYITTSLIFALFAFTGIWKLYLFFYKQYPHLHKQLAISILFFPSLIFWSSGIMKDPICISALGWLTYSLYELLFLRKKIFKNLVLIFVFGYLLSVIKLYILISYVPFFILFIILKNMQKIRNNFTKYVLTSAFLFVSVLGFTSFLNSYDDELGNYSMQGVAGSVEKLNEAYEARDGDMTAESNFSLGVDFDGTPGGFVRLAPAAIFATFFRPLPWEAHKISQFMACVESLALFLFTLFVLIKAGPIRFFRIIFSEAIITYCFLFSLVFAVFVGASTLNFGSLVRYKIPSLPFYAIALFLIYEKAKIIARDRRLQREKSIQPSVLSIIPAVG